MRMRRMSTSDCTAFAATRRVGRAFVYDRWGQSLSAFEHSPLVSASSSKFDVFLAGKYTLTADEIAGYNLFRGKANCSSCHLDGRSATLKPGQTDTSTAANVTPMFTCFGYANLGLPLNPSVALFYQTKPDDFGFTPNPYGFGYRDLGLGRHEPHPTRSPRLTGTSPIRSRLWWTELEVRRLRNSSSAACRPVADYPL